MSWGEELRRPANIIGMVIGAIGIFAGALTGWYFHEKGEKAGRVSLLVDQVQVFDKAHLGTAPLRVLNSKGEVVENNVFAASVVVWNSGNAEIKRSDIRKPFTIVVGHGITPLDLTATYYSEENTDHFNLSPDGAIDWVHFDPGQGLKMRIVYVSDEVQTVILRGLAVGTASIQAETQAEKNRRDEKWSWPWILAAGATILVSFSGGFIFFRQWRKQSDINYYISGFVMLASATILILGLIGAWIINGPYPNPPF